jgi:hypothetical protein
LPGKFIVLSERGKLYVEQQQHGNGFQTFHNDRI